MSENVENNTERYVQGFKPNVRKYTTSSLTETQFPENRRELLEIMAETPRMHQPYTCPHHRNHQSSFWKVGSVMNTSGLLIHLELK